MIKYTKISISENGRWIGDGMIQNGIVYDCGASFGDPDQTELVYQAIDAAIARGESSVEHKGNRYGWAIWQQLG